MSQSEDRKSIFTFCWWRPIHTGYMRSVKYRWFTAFNSDYFTWVWMGSMHAQSHGRSRWIDLRSEASEAAWRFSTSIEWTLGRESSSINSHVIIIRNCLYVMTSSLPLAARQTWPLSRLASCSASQADCDERRTWYRWRGRRKVRPPAHICPSSSHALAPRYPSADSRPDVTSRPVHVSNAVFIPLTISYHHHHHHQFICSIQYHCFVIIGRYIA